MKQPNISVTDNYDTAAPTSYEKDNFDFGNVGDMDPFAGLGADGSRLGNKDDFNILANLTGDGCPSDDQNDF